MMPLVEQIDDLACVHSDDLGIVGIHALMERTKVAPASIDDIIIGASTRIGEQANVARDISLAMVLRSKSRA